MHLADLKMEGGHMDKNVINFLSWEWFWLTIDQEVRTLVLQPQDTQFFQQECFQVNFLLELPGESLAWSMP